MKKNNLTILLFLFTVFFASTIFATTTNVTAGDHKIIDAVNAAADGDIIVLTTSGGAYIETWTINLNKNITIKAADGLAEKPIISFNSNIWNMFNINPTSEKTFTFEGIVFEGYVDAATNSDRCFWVRENVALYSLYVDGCDFQNFDNEVMVAEGDNKSTATKISFTHSKFLNLNSNALFFRTWGAGSAPGVVAELFVEYCTFWNVNGLAIDVTAHDQSYTTTDPKVTINHVTIHSSTNPYESMQFPFCDYATVKNCIVQHTNLTNGSGTVKIWGANSVANNNVTNTQWNIVGYDGATQLNKVATLSNNLASTDPQFVDAANGDLKLQAGSPAINYGDDGENAGDTYWGNEDPVPVELTTFAAKVVNNNAVLNWETATEVNNYGFNIERSSFQKEGTSSRQDGWEKVAFVEGHGNSNSPKYYEYIDNTANFGKYSYRLKQVDIDGSFEYSKTVEVELGNAPSEFSLSQNYPNPFNPTTSIKFSIKEVSMVKLSVYNVIGELVTELINKNMEAGYHKVNFDASELNSGIYLYKLEADGFVQQRKMMLVK